MARRRGKPGDHLATSDYSGKTVYASKLNQDYWGDYGLAGEILERNLQEIATPFGDPYPVSLYRGPLYEQTTPGQFGVLPTFIGNTTRPFLTDSAYAQAFDLQPGIGSMAVSTTFVVR